VLEPPVAGLCDRCRQARIVTSARGSRFILCERSRWDARFPRYPRLPVLACEGFERRDDRAARDESGEPPPSA